MWMKADSMTCSGQSLCPTPRELLSNENYLDDRQERAERLFLLTGRICLYRDIPASHRFLHIYGGTILRARIGRPPDLFRLASLAISVPGSGSRHEALVRRTEIGDDGASFHHAGDHLAGDPGKIPGQLDLP